MLPNAFVSSEHVRSLKMPWCGAIMFCRVQSLSRAQILQEFRIRCQELAANDNRGFKQEFEVKQKVLNVNFQISLSNV